MNLKEWNTWMVLKNEYPVVLGVYIYAVVRYRLYV